MFFFASRLDVRFAVSTALAKAVLPVCVAVVKSGWGRVKNLEDPDINRQSPSFIIINDTP